MPTIEQIAWCGGVIDAIGLVRTRQTEADSLLAYVSVSTAQLPIANRLAALTGTKVTTVRRDYTRLGCSQHCEEPHLHVESVTARWSLTRARALVFLSSIEPYLVFKLEDTRRVLEETKDAPRKGTTVSKMTQLGWIYKENE